VSWEQLLDVQREAALLAATEAARPPSACPNDGEPLESGPSGELHCPWDGYIWDGVGRAG
jgi:hypothetical protein